MALTQYDVSLSIRKVTPENPSSPSSLTISNLDPNLFETRKYDTSDPKSLSVDLSAHHWSHYFLAGYLGAFDSMPSSSPPPPPSHIEVIISGNVPSGAGLSSSSALVVASTLATFTIYGTSVTRNDLALAAIEGERYVGTLSGGMDQSASILSRANMALNIEFVPTLTSTPINLPSGVVFVICNCLKKKEKAVDASLYYNKRVVECRLAALCIAKHKGLDGGDVKTLRNVVDQIVEKGVRDMGEVIAELSKHCEENDSEEAPTLEDISATLGVPKGDILELYFSDRKVQCSAVLNDSPSFDIWKRSRHVFDETLRVKSVLSSPLDDKAVDFGILMNESHESCRSLFDCSCSELDDLVAVCRDAGAIGSRLTGAGWGGCTVSCVEEGRKDEFIREVTEKYYEGRMGFERGELPEGSICVSLGGSGASIVEV